MPDTIISTDVLPVILPRAPVRVTRRRSRVEKILSGPTFWRGLTALVVFAIVWEVGARSKLWFGVELPFFGKLPAPTEVLAAASHVVDKPGYWASWYQSIRRVLTGFILAQIIGIPFGLALAVNKYFRDFFFAPFEILRPIRPSPGFPPR